MTTSATRSAAFKNVFGDIQLRAPQRQYRQHDRMQFSASELHQQLKEWSRHVLGIGNEDYTYKHKEASDDIAYRTLYQICPKTSFLPPADHSMIDAPQIVAARKRLFSIFKQALTVFSGESLRKTFAKIMDELMGEFVSWSYAREWAEETEVTAHLKYWVNNIFSRLIVLVLNTLRAWEGGSTSLEISERDRERWQDMALTRLGALRVDELFDMIVGWDETMGGIDDLRQYLTNPITRSYLTTNFIRTLETRLLHPGASTIEILQLYISIIRAFRRLDPRGVLLERVARTIRKYLRDREDTVKVIVTGLLSDAYDSEGNPLPHDPDVLSELAVELSSRDQETVAEDRELDWDNLEWVPDPIDAAPDYRKSKNTDVIGSLISLFESKEIFVKELQVTLADRLLKNKDVFDQEISVLEHLKIRFGDQALQACEVMLRDVLDSRKVNQVVRLDQGLQTNTDTVMDQDAALNAKILSRLFWPPLQEQEFKVPREILEQQARYEKGFESLKQSRKLTWLNNLGQVTIELKLEDRPFVEEVLPWQAAVIYAFQSDNSDVALSVDQLASTLEMSPTLVRSACIFWLSKHILSETSADTYTVLERLPSGTALAAQESAVLVDPAAMAEATAAQAAKESEEAARQEKMGVYKVFVTSMLTNNGAMPLPRIAMLLGMMVQGGFQFTNEELKDFLTGMVREGLVELGHGGAYKVVT